MPRIVPASRNRFMVDMPVHICMDHLASQEGNDGEEADLLTDGATYIKELEDALRPIAECAAYTHGDPRFDWGRHIRHIVNAAKLLGMPVSVANEARVRHGQS